MSFISWLQNLYPEIKNAKMYLKRYSEVSQQVFVVLEELRSCRNPRAHAYAQAAQGLLTIADAVLGLRFANSNQDIRLTPQIRQLADAWYKQIPELVVAARQEAVLPCTAVHILPVELNVHKQLISGNLTEAYLSGIRRAVFGINQLVAEKVARARAEPETFKATLLLNEAARTYKKSGDLLADSTNDRRAPKESRHDALEHYWRALPRYFLVAQGLEDPELMNQFASFKFRPCKLDSDDPWKVTSPGKITTLREQGLYESTFERLKMYWEKRGFSDHERELEWLIELLELKGDIEQDGNWSDFPYPRVYEVVAEFVILDGQRIPEGYEFVYNYGEEGKPGRLQIAKQFDVVD